MSKHSSSKSLPQFSWEEWDQQLVVVLYRSDRRFVVKRYVERVFANSSRWQQCSEKAFAHIEPIPRAYPMKENEVKLMHEIFTWHFNGTLKFPIIAGLDQMVDWEDLLDLIERAELFFANHGNEELPSTKSPSLVPTIPVGLLSSTTKSKTHSITPIKSKSAKKISNENHLSTNEGHWIQINNICVPYLLRSQQTRYLPYQILLDCDLLNDDEDRLVRQLTIAATSNDIQTFQRIISSTSSIDFKLAEDLRLIDLFHLIFAMSKVVYVKFVQQQKFVNKTFKNVLAQHGGTVQLFSYSIPFIRLGKIDYILLESFNSAMKPSKKILSILRRRALPAETHEIECLRLIQFYQRKASQHDDEILLRSNEEQLLISINEIGKQMENLPVVYDASLNEYQRNQHEKLVEDLMTNIRKATKRKANGAMTELKNLRVDKTSDVQ